jgi:uncharacterized protein YhfF
MEYTVWKKYLEYRESIGNHDAVSYVFAEHFCNDKPSADKLYQLAISGKKRATTGSIWAYEYDKEPMLKAGDLTILTNYDETRACVLKTKSVVVKKFKEITEEDARIEGEGDSSLEYWRRVHIEYFEEECKRIGREFSEEMPVAFEEFEIEYKND